MRFYHLFNSRFSSFSSTISIFGKDSITMMTFLKTILIILLVYFGLKFLLKWAKPYVISYVAKKAGKQFEKMFQRAANPSANTSEAGKTTIDHNPTDQKKSKNTVGEYVDFEDVE